MADEVVRDIPEEMVEKATFWNERVHRIDPTREGQPLRWWYGPLKASSDPNQKWCHDCYGVVEESGGRRRCRLCKASQPLLADAIEAAADAVTRELAPTWVRYPVGIRSVPDLRVLIGQVLSAALAGRQVVDLPEPDGVDEDGDTYWKYPGGKAWSRANGRFDEKTAARFRAMAGALLAAVEHNEHNERTHLAAGSGSGEG